MPKLEATCALALPAIAIGYAFFDNDGAKEILSYHRFYSVGMTSALFGGFFGVMHGLKDRAEEAVKPVKGFLQRKADEFLKELDSTDIRFSPV